MGVGVTNTAVPHEAVSLELHRAKASGSADSEDQELLEVSGQLLVPHGLARVADFKAPPEPLKLPASSCKSIAPVPLAPATASQYTVEAVNDSALPAELTSMPKTGVCQPEPTPGSIDKKGALFCPDHSGVADGEPLLSL